MRNVFERMSNLAPATISVGYQKACSLVKGAIGLKSRLLTVGRRLAAARVTGLMSKVVVVALLGLLLFVLVAPHFGFVFLTIMGNSMSPALPAGSVAIVQPVADSEIEVGDVIAYRSTGEHSPMVTHRVTEVLGQDGSLSFQTGGDRNEEPDRNPVASSSIVGKVRFHIPLLGFLLNFVGQPIGYGLLVGLPAMVIITWEIRRITGQIGRWRERKRQGVM